VDLPRRELVVQAQQRLLLQEDAQREQRCTQTEHNLVRSLLQRS
jgi:hypothetical protein